jgi:hypothetical protein
MSTTNDTCPKCHPTLCHCGVASPSALWDWHHRYGCTAPRPASVWKQLSGLCAECGTWPATPWSHLCGACEVESVRAILARRAQR